MRRVLWIVHVLSSFDTAATANQHLRKRIGVVRVAVGHVAAEQNDGMVKYRTVAIGHVLEALGEFRENRGVIVLDESEVRNTFRISTPMRSGVERLAD